MERKTAFAPIVNARTRLLVLGSLPGEASLQASQYYAHPRNSFWQLIGHVIRLDLSALTYEARLSALLAAGIGLWDVIASANRTGSLDTSIRAPETADLNGLISELPGLRAIAFNGKTSSRLARRILPAQHDLQLFDLPSSSPAFTQSLPAKAKAWSVLTTILSQGDQPA